jgi:hypothetical protein
MNTQSLMMDSNHSTTMSSTEGTIYDIIFAGGQFHPHRELEFLSQLRDLPSQEAPLRASQRAV